MPAPQKRIAAGNIYSFLSFLDDYGLQTGANTTQPAAGSSSGAMRIWGIQEARRQILEPDVFGIDGDDTKLGDFAFDNTGSSAYIATAAVSDEQLESKLLGTTVRTIAGIRYYEDDIPNPPDFPCVVWHQGRAKSQDSNKGANGYEGSILHYATVRALGRPSYNMREGATYRFQITRQLATKDWRGITINNNESGTDSSRSVKYSSQYPVHMQPFSGAGSAAAVQLDYTPVDATLTRFLVETGQSTGAMHELGNAASISAANKTATPPSSIASGLHGIVVYQFAV